MIAGEPDRGRLVRCAVRGPSLLASNPEATTHSSCSTQEKEEESIGLRLIDAPTGFSQLLDFDNTWSGCSLSYDWASIRPRFAAHSPRHPASSAVAHARFPRCTISTGQKGLTGAAAAVRCVRSIPLASQALAAVVGDLSVTPGLYSDFEQGSDECFTAISLPTVDGRRPAGVAYRMGRTTRVLPFAGIMAVSPEVSFELMAPRPKSPGALIG